MFPFSITKRSERPWDQRCQERIHQLWAMLHIRRILWSSVPGKSIAQNTRLPAGRHAFIQLGRAYTGFSGRCHADSCRLSWKKRAEVCALYPRGTICPEYAIFGDRISGSLTARQCCVTNLRVSGPSGQHKALKTNARSKDTHGFSKSCLTL